MTEKKKVNLRFGVIALMVLMAAFSRLVPHPPNFTPIGAMALFGAACFSQRILSFTIPIVSLWLSDLVINNVMYAKYFDHFVWFYQGFYWTYGAFILIGLLGFVVLKKVRIQNILIASILASIVFFMVSNFGVWASTTMYPDDLNGLIICYSAGLPFLKNTLMGDLVYTGVLFGVFEFAQYKIPSIQFGNGNAGN